MLPVYILIRTSGRQKFFAQLMRSIEAQTYKNIITIVHTDDERDTYVKGNIIVRGKRHPRHAGTAPYNLYNNSLLNAIPAGPGWYIFIDDDDMYAGPDVIARYVAAAREDCINVARSQRNKNTIWPKHWKGQNSFQTECFMLHTKYAHHKDKNGRRIKWWNKTGGDHHYTKQITRILPINWIDGLIVCRAQDGKNRGMRRDLGDPKPMKRMK